MQHEECPNLILGEPVRPFEVVDLDLAFLFLRLDFLGGNRAIRKCRKKLVYFGLRQYVFSQDSSPFPLCSTSSNLLQQEARDVNIVDRSLSKAVIQGIFQLLLQRILFGCVELLKRRSTQELHRRVKDLCLRDGVDLAVLHHIGLAGIELHDNARLEILAGTTAADIDQDAFLRIAELVEHARIMARLAAASILRMRRGLRL